MRSSGNRPQTGTRLAPRQDQCWTSETECRGLHRAQFRTAAKADAKTQLKTADANKTANQKTVEARIKADKKSLDARQDAASGKRDADYAVAKEKCDAFAGDTKDRCITEAKARFGKS